jgi:phosphoglycolate phosphatase
MGADPMPRPTFIFDYDGTLCDTVDAIADALAHTSRQFGGKAPGEATLRALVGTGRTLEETFRDLWPSGQDCTAPALAQWVALYRIRYAEQAEGSVRLYEGVADCLGRLRAVGNMVLLSNKGASAVLASLHHFGIHHLFDCILAAEPGQPCKPHPDVLGLRIAPVLPEVDAACCIVIGDTATDLQFAGTSVRRPAMPVMATGTWPRAKRSGTRTH